MATLWDLLTGNASLTDGGAPQQQPTGLLSALAGSTAAPMGSGFVPGQATPQAPRAPLNLFGALAQSDALGTALAPYPRQNTAGVDVPAGGTTFAGDPKPAFQQGTGINTMGTAVRDASNNVADAQAAGLPSFFGLPDQSPHAVLSNSPGDLQIGRGPQGFAAIKPAPAAADVPAAGATPTMGQGVPGGAGPAIRVPGYDGTFTRGQADDGDGRPSQQEWDAASGRSAGLSAPVASGLAAGKGLAAASGLPAVPAAAPASATGTTTAQPGFLDGLKNGLRNLYGNGGPGDALINLGIGMMSGPGGMQRALQMQQQAGQNRASQALQQLQLQMQLAKFQQDQQAQAGAVSYIKAAYKAQGQDLSDDQARSIAANSGALSTIVSGTFKDKAASPQLVDVPQPDGSTQKQWITPGSATGTAVGSSATKTPDAVRDLQFARQNWQANGLPDPNNPANAGFWQDFAQKRLAGGGGVSVTLPPAEKASDMAYGQAEGKHFGDILAAGDTARQTQGQLAFMNDAFNQGGGNISTGPFAKSILAAKQAILNTTGVDLGGVPESEAVNKLGFGLATNLTKEISQRPAQQEFIKALQNVPGLLLSPQGSRVMQSIINQQSQTKIDLSDLVQDPDNRKNWGQTVKNYYATHPYISPFTGKPLNKDDLNTLRASAPQGGASTAAPSVPSWSVVGD